MINEELILNLVEDTDKILYTFEKDGKFAMSSSIRNELFQEANASLKQVKEALAQPAQALDKFFEIENELGLHYDEKPTQDGNVCARCGGIVFDPVLEEPAQEPDRQTLQANGTHPAPCARHCEATAFNIVIRNLKAQLAQPAPPPECKTEAEQTAYAFGWWKALEAQPRNFCPRCGKRTPDLTTIHTCTPPRGLEMT